MNVVGLHSRFQISPLLGHLVGQFLPLQVSGIESIPQDFRDEGANIIHLFFPPNHGGGVNVGTWIFLYPSFFFSNEPRYLLLSLLLTFFDEILLCFEMTMSLEIKIVKNVKGQSRRH